MRNEIDDILAEPNLLDVVVAAEKAFGYLPTIQMAETAKQFRQRLHRVMSSRLAQREFDEETVLDTSPLRSVDETTTRVTTAVRLINDRAGRLNEIDGERVEARNQRLTPIINAHARAQELNITI